MTKSLLLDVESVRKLDPRLMIRNPVMFVVLIGSLLTTVAAVVEPSVFAWSITVWLWLTRTTSCSMIGPSSSTSVT